MNIKEHLEYMIDRLEGNVKAEDNRILKKMGIIEDNMRSLESTKKSRVDNLRLKKFYEKSLKELNNDKT